MKAAAIDRVAQFRRYMTIERNLSAHTDSNYARDLAALIKFCDARKLDDWSVIDSQHIRQFAADSHSKGLAGRSRESTHTIFSLCAAAKRAISSRNAGVTTPPVSVSA